MSASTRAVHHVAVTFDGANMKIYVDGLPVASGSRSSRALSDIDDRQNWLGRAQKLRTPRFS